jgi:hypothetical protein
MKSQTVTHLLALNKQFYQTFGHEFSSTRQRLQPGVLQVVDSLAVARHGWEDAPATFIRADLSGPDWDRKILASLKKPFDLVTAFASLHHIPSQGMRLSILNKARAMLHTGGKFIHSEWQFMNSDKLKDRIQPWEDAGLTSEDVDEGDYLMDWRSGGRGLRYVHHFYESELEALAAASRFRVRQTFRSDGANGLLALYQVWETV